MIVSELIEQLKKVDPNLKVVVDSTGYDDEESFSASICLKTVDLMTSNGESYVNYKENVFNSAKAISQKNGWKIDYRRETCFALVEGL